MTVASQVKQTVASLKGAKATLDLYTNQSPQQNEREIYRRYSQQLETIIEQLEDRVSVIEWEEPQYKGF
jgi:hypothetical protein